MNKDYKLTAALIPIILILSLTLYFFPDSSGIVTDLATPVLNQTNNTNVNQTAANTSSVATQTTDANSVQTSQQTDSNNYYYQPSDSSTNSGSDGSITDPTEPTNPTEPTDPVTNGT